MSSPGRLRAVFLVVAVSVVSVLWSPAAYARSDELTSSSPPGGAALATAPHAVVLDFSAAPQAELSHVSVRTSDGDEVDSGELTGGDDGTLRQPVEITRPGDYTIAYHVVFVDGKQTVGLVQFSVGTGVAPSPMAGAVAQAKAVDLVSQHVHGVDPFGAALLVVDALVLVAVLALLWLRRPGES